MQGTRSRNAFWPLLCSGLAGFLMIWLLVPAPHAILWVVALGATEWSLWFGALGMIGAALGAIALRRGLADTQAAHVPSPARKKRLTLWLAVLMGLFAALVSLLPLLAMLPLARANGVTLSLTRYLFGNGDANAGKRVATVPYAVADGQTLLLDIYRDPAAAEPRPAIIVIHGGSWSGGDKSDFASWDRWLAASGYVVLDIQYRLTPQPNWQTATGDVKAAIGWTRRHAAEYGIDKSRIALLGRSAGAHLALLAAYSAGDKALPPDDGSPDTPVRAVVSLYGPADLVWGYNHTAFPDVIHGPRTLRKFLGGSPETVPGIYRIASPIERVGPKTPPTLLIHGERDRLVGPQHSERLASRLTAASIPNETLYIPYGLHGFDIHRDGWGGQVEQVVLLRFLQAHLGR